MDLGWLVIRRATRRGDVHHRGMLARFSGEAEPAAAAGQSRFGDCWVSEGRPGG